MEPFHEYMNEYKTEMEKGSIRKAYKGLMEYMGQLKSYFKNKYPDYSVHGNIYCGYLDMTYFSLLPKSLKDRKLKIAIVFIHEKVRFEVWLAGYNRNIQRQYRELFRNSDWNKYHVTPSGKGVDSIVDHVLIANPDFSDLDILTKQIDTGTLEFIKDIGEFLSKH